MVRLKDIADMAGVTPATVSAALSGRGRVGTDTRAQIVKIAEELNYQPNTAAQILKNKPAVDIGLLVSGGVTEIVPAFIDICEEKNLSHQLELIGNEQKAAQYPALVRERRAAGILYVGYIYEKIWNFINRNPDYPFVTIDETSNYCVRSDFRTGVYEAIKYLRSFGHRRIAMSYGYLGYDTFLQAKKGMDEAARDLDIVQDEVLFPMEISNIKTHDTMPESIQWGDFLFSQPEEKRPTAVFCSGLHTARAIIYCALVRGLRVPEDVSIIGIGTKGSAESGFPYITTVERDYPEIVKNAVMILQDRLRGDDMPRNISVVPKLELRQSVAECKRR